MITPTYLPTSRVVRATRQLVQLRIASSAKRSFSISAKRNTDGVYKELTTVRVQTPWIEALRMQRAEQEQTQSAATAQARPPEERDLSPKHMRESYHSVVSAVAAEETPCSLTH